MDTTPDNATIDDLEPALDENDAEDDVDLGRSLAETGEMLSAAASRAAERAQDRAVAKFLKETKLEKPALYAEVEERNRNRPFLSERTLGRREKRERAVDPLRAEETDWCGLESVLEGGGEGTHLHRDHYRAPGEDLRWSRYGVIESEAEERADWDEFEKEEARRLAKLTGLVARHQPRRYGSVQVAKDWLRETYPEGGDVTPEILFRVAAAETVGKEDTVRQAAKEMGVEIRRVGGRSGHSVWRLPNFRNSEPTCRKSLEGEREPTPA